VEQIREAFRDYYKNLMGTEPSQQCNFNPQPLYPESLELSGLDEPFSLEEIYNAVQSLANNKASGPDGLPAKFLQLNWEALAPDIMKIVQQFYHLQLDMTPLNKAHMVLIPKGASTSNMENYRSISVINLILKLISKVLPNRLKHHLPVLISAQ
jgi:hypothetical protein